MPYTTPIDRARIDPSLGAFLDGFTDRFGQMTEGDLNYTLTRIIAGWIRTYTSYAKINTAIGVLECAKLELYRRLAAPYEDTKIAQNGDIPEYNNAPNDPPAAKE